MDNVNIEMNRLVVDYVINNDADIVWQPGGRYSGKSFGMEQVSTINLTTKENYKLLVIEDKEGNVNQGTKAGILSRIDEFQFDKAFDDTKKPAEITNKINGNKALFKGYTTEDQIKQVKALNQVTAIWYEEAEKVTKEKIEDLYFQLRGGNPEDRKLYATLNPVNPECYANELIQDGPDEVLEYFPGTKRPKVFYKYVDTTFDYEGKTHTVRLKHLFIISTHHDNAFLELKQRAAIEALKATDYNKWLQLAEARFIRPEGTFFKEFRKETHVIEPFIIPEHWTRYVSLDYGLDKLAVLWYAVDPYENVYVYREIHQSDLIVSEAAKMILDYNGTDKIHTFYAPPDLWGRNRDSGKSTYETFYEHGINLYQSGNNREQGWLAVKEGVKVFEQRHEHTGETYTTSKVQVFENCKFLINYLPRVLRDDKKPNDVAKEPHELTHICDAFRYYCIVRYGGYKEEVKQQLTDDDYQHDAMKDWNNYY